VLEKELTAASGFGPCGYAVYTQNTFVTVSPTVTGKTVGHGSRSRAKSADCFVSEGDCHARSDHSMSSSTRASTPDRDDDARVAALDGVTEAVLRAGGTTLMIHGVPSVLMYEDVLPLFVELGFQETDFDYMYMPLDNRTRRGGRGGVQRPSNLGYLFINCVTPEIASRFVWAIYDYDFPDRTTKKPVRATMATTQGVKANVQNLVASWRKNKSMRAFRTNDVYLRNSAAWQLIPIEQLRFNPVMQDVSVD